MRQLCQHVACWPPLLLWAGCLLLCITQLSDPVAAYSETCETLQKFVDMRTGVCNQEAAMKLISGIDGEDKRQMFVANWMEKLYDCFTPWKDLPLSRISLPGAHDAGINELMTPLVSFITVTQGQDFLTLLGSGIRWFDCRFDFFQRVIPFDTYPQYHYFQHGGYHAVQSWESLWTYALPTWFNGPNKNELVFIQISHDMNSASGDYYGNAYPYPYWSLFYDRMYKSGAFDYVLDAKTIMEEYSKFPASAARNAAGYSNELSSIPLSWWFDPRFTMGHRNGRTPTGRGKIVLVMDSSAEYADVSKYVNIIDDGFIVDGSGPTPPSHSRPWLRRYMQNEYCDPDDNILWPAGGSQTCQKMQSDDIDSLRKVLAGWYADSLDNSAVNGRKNDYANDSIAAGMHLVQWQLTPSNVFAYVDGLEILSQYNQLAFTSSGHEQGMTQSTWCDIIARYDVPPGVIIYDYASPLDTYTWADTLSSRGTPNANKGWAKGIQAHSIAIFLSTLRMPNSNTSGRSTAVTGGDADATAGPLSSRQALSPAGPPVAAAASVAKLYDPYHLHCPDFKVKISKRRALVPGGSAKKKVAVWDVAMDAPEATDHHGDPVDGETLYITGLHIPSNRTDIGAQLVKHGLQAGNTVRIWGAGAAGVGVFDSGEYAQMQTVVIAGNRSCEPVLALCLGPKSVALLGKKGGCELPHYERLQRKYGANILNVTLPWNKTVGSGNFSTP